MRLEMKGLIEKLNTTAVFVTHDQMEAMSMSDWIIVMKKAGLNNKVNQKTYTRGRRRTLLRILSVNQIGSKLTVCSDRRLLH